MNSSTTQNKNDNIYIQLWSRKRQPTPVFLLEKSLVGYSLWRHKESDMTEQLSIHTYTTY